MRNHVRHNRSERSQPTFQEGDEREFAPPASVAETEGAETESAENAEDAGRTDTARTVRAVSAVPADDSDGDDDSDDTYDAFDEDFADVVRLTCPDCGRPIAVFADEDNLPEHALCPTPWNPFGLTVCDGSGRAVTEARPLADAVRVQDRERDGEWGVLLTLPVGIDWRTQPFSHVGGPGSRPMRVPEQRLAA